MRRLNGLIIVVCRQINSYFNLISQHWPNRPFLLALQASINSNYGDAVGVENA